MRQIMRSSLHYAGFAQLCRRSPIMRAHYRIIPQSLGLGNNTVSVGPMLHCSRFAAVGSVYERHRSTAAVAQQERHHSTVLSSKHRAVSCLLVGTWLHVVNQSWNMSECLARKCGVWQMELFSWRCRFFLASFYTKYDRYHFVVNALSLLTVLIPKLPQFHGVRLFGINTY